MSALVRLAGDTAVTDSLAIADGTDLDHASVIKLVRTYTTDLQDFGLVRFEIRPRLTEQHGGGDVEFAILNEQQATLLITYMRNSDIVRGFKKRLVKAFFDLAQQARANPFVSMSRVDLLQFAAQVETERLALEHKVTVQAEKIEADAPKLNAFDHLTEAGGSFCLTDAAKALKIGRDKFTRWLHAHGWIYRRFGTDWIGHAEKERAGYMTHKVVTYRNSSGEDCAKDQVRVTPKGLTKLATLLAAGTEQAA